jgi:uncharacterized circularly permuted ATP-grasp superfamily protein/uncharacterized alpha-E superfamily protein
MSSTFQPKPLTPLSSPPKADAWSDLDIKHLGLNAAHKAHFQELIGASLESSIEPEFTSQWQTFFQEAQLKGPTDLDQKQSELERQIKENGITYNVYSDQDGPQRPWSLDLFPLIINRQDWQSLESALTHQVQLLQLILTDVYGAQNLLKKGLIPSALIHGHPGFLRGMHGVDPLGGVHLHIAAFDVARAPSGEWRLISQRTQAPSGLGYLLENRGIISKLFPHSLATLGIHSLSQSYRAFMEQMKQSCKGMGQPHIALLTPGPYNETYFEHAYLARYLGVTLVQGRDLTVRNQHLYLNTLRGLEPIHGLIKRLDDEFLDPLELREDSTLGVPGLMQVIRAGNVMVANAPGTGFLESPAILGFLPAISNELMGTSLKINSLPTWWCGEQAAYENIQADLSECVIKPTYPFGAQRDFREQTLLGRLLGEDSLSQLRKSMQEQGAQYTAQKYLPLSELPTWHKGQFEPHSVLLRVFAVYNSNQQWSILPGGLARLASPERPMASMQRGGSSADVWVQGQAHAPTVQVSVSTTHEPELMSKKRLVTSRAAENLFWLGRYSERSENILRFVQLSLEGLNNDAQHSSTWRQWVQIMSCRQGIISPDAGNCLLEPKRFAQDLVASLDQAQNATSLGFNLRALHLSASAVRERLSLDHWHLIETTQKNFSHAAQHWGKDQHYSLTDVFRHLRIANEQMSAITGAQIDRMIRDDGWRLLSIGRHVERLGFLSSALECAIICEGLSRVDEDDSSFLSLLSLFDSTITFQAQYQQSRSLAALFDLLMLDQDNPRSLAWVAQTLKGRLSKLARRPSNELDELALQVLDPQSIEQLSFEPQHVQASLSSIGERLKQIWDQSLKMNDLISEKYFTHSLALSPNEVAPSRQNNLF